jgi:hypothetical protein
VPVHEPEGSVVPFAGAMTNCALTAKPKNREKSIEENKKREFS